MDTSAGRAVSHDGEIAPIDQQAPPRESDAAAHKRNALKTVGVVAIVLILFIIVIVSIFGTGNDTNLRSGNPTAPDPTSNPCDRECVARLSSNPDVLAPHCKHVTPLSAYQECIKNAAGHIANLCLDECKIPHK